MRGRTSAHIRGSRTSCGLVSLIVNLLTIPYTAFTAPLAESRIYSGQSYGRVFFNPL